MPTAERPSMRVGRHSVRRPRGPTATFPPSRHPDRFGWKTTSGSVSIPSYSHPSRSAAAASSVAGPLSPRTWRRIPSWWATRRAPCARLVPTTHQRRGGSRSRSLRGGKHFECALWYSVLERNGRSARAVGPDVAFLLQMQQDLLRRLLRRHIGRINREIRVGRLLVRVGNPSELFYDSRARLGVEALAVPLLAYLERRGDVHEEVAPAFFDQRPVFLPDIVVRRNRCADRDAAVFGDLAGHKSDAPDVDVAMLLGKSQLGREVLPHQVAV